MAKEKFNEEDGVWRTIGGRKVFIRKGQNLADAMIESGKFSKKGNMRESYRKEIDKIEDERKEAKSEEQRLKRETDSLANAYSNNRYGYGTDYWGKNWNDARKMTNEQTKEVANYDAMLDKENTKTKQLEKSKAFDKENGKTYPYREQYKQEGATDLENIKEWEQYRDANQKALNRTSIPYNAQRNLNEINVANKEIEKSRKNLDESADEILGKQDKIKKDLKEAYDGELNDLSKGWAKLNDSNEDSKIEQKEIKRLAKEEMKARKSSKSDPYDDPESEESQRLQSIQSRYDDYLQKTEGRGASYGEIAYVDSLRGKDLDNFEKELDDFEANGNKKDDTRLRKEINGYLDDVKRNDSQFESKDDFYNYMNKNWYNVDKDDFDRIYDEEENKRNKSTNETMNNAIREKASNKNKEYESLINNFYALSFGDSSQNYEDTKDVPFSEKEKAVKSSLYMDDSDILDRFGEDYGYDNNDKLKNLKSQIDYMRNPGETINQTAKRFASGGDFLIYNGDMEDYLKLKGIKYNDDNMFDKYTQDMADRVEKLYNQESNKSMNDSIRSQANVRNEWKQYLKDHPESNMSLSKFKNMKK